MYSVNWGTGPLSLRLLFIGGVLGGGTSGSHSGPNFCLNSVAGVIIVLRITSATQGKLLQS